MAQMLSAKTRWAVIGKTKGYCSYCGIWLAPPCIDHVIPRSKGGGDEIENLLPCCKTCNSKKRDKTLEEFRDWVAENIFTVNLRHYGWASRFYDQDTLDDLDQAITLVFRAIGKINTVFWFEKEGLDV